MRSGEGGCACTYHALAFIHRINRVTSVYGYFNCRSRLVKSLLTKLGKPSKKIG